MEAAPLFAQVADGPDEGSAWWLVTEDGVRIRAGPVAEAMMACVILDHLLLHRGQVGDGPRGVIG